MPRRLLHTRRYNNNHLPSVQCIRASDSDKYSLVQALFAKRGHNAWLIKWISFAGMIIQIDFCCQFSYTKISLSPPKGQKFNRKLDE